MIHSPARALSLLAVPPLLLALLAPQPASAQAQTPFDVITDEGIPSLDLPGLREYTPGTAAGFRDVSLEARLTPDGEPVSDGIVWRVYHPTPGPDGKLPLLATTEGGSARFEFEPGEYYLHVAFGKAGVTKRLSVPASGPIETQSLILNAGGLKLNATSGGVRRLAEGKVRFTIYTEAQDADGDRGLVVADVEPGTVVRLNAGTYHVVSDYGNVNAMIRSDIRVEAGKLTEATIEHRAAELTLKLVANEGGEAIADTAWSVLTSAGDLVSESVGAFPSLVLTEGAYTAVARNKGRIFQRDFRVVAGRNQDVEVRLDDEIKGVLE